MLVALIPVCALAVWLDVRSRRLPNWLTAGALALALVLRAASGLDALGAGLASAGLAFAFGFPFFMMGGLGAGDVKLMAALAAFLDPGSLPVALGAMALTGAAMALLAAARRGLLGQTLAGVHLLVLGLGRSSFGAWRGGEEQAAPRPNRGSAVTNPYGVAIVAGALAGWFL